MDQLLSIGDFAARCGLSPKMLRSYASAGLLVPDAVDTYSGYRYYSTRQLPQARVVSLLRQAGIPVAEIAGFFESPDPARLDEWDHGVVEDSAVRRRALAEARSALATEVPPDHRPRSEHQQKGTPPMADLQTGTATHIGGRTTNDDAVLINDRVLAIADGLGGHRDGGVASRLALNTLASALGAGATTSGLLAAVKEANRAVHERGCRDGAEQAMATTLTALAATSDAGLVVVQVGDSRLYRSHDGQLASLTKDHTVTAEMVRDGKLSVEKAVDHPHRHMLTRAVGVDGDVQVDHARVESIVGDRFVLCTDGVTNEVTDDEIAGILAAEEDPQRCAEQIVAAAADRHADDNATALVAAVR